MDTYRIISFMLNRKLLTNQDLECEQFMMTKRDFSNLIYMVQSCNTHKVVKLKRNPDDFSNRTLLRESFFYDFFKDQKKELGFSENISFSKIYQNNSIFVRDYVDGYTSADRIFVETADKTTLITSIAEKLKALHQVKWSLSRACKSLTEHFKNYFNERDLKPLPLLITVVPPLSKYKLAPAHIREFWRILNQSDNKSKLESVINEVLGSWKSKTLVHGDFRLPNILFKEKDKKEKDTFNDHIFIDFELWHLGDPKWDLACFLYDLELCLKKDITSYHSLSDTFLDTYCNANPKIKDCSDFKKKVKQTLILLKLQNLYAELSPGNISQLSVILNAI